MVMRCRPNLDGTIHPNIDQSEPKLTGESYESMRPSKNFVTWRTVERRCCAHVEYAAAELVVKAGLCVGGLCVHPICASPTHSFVLEKCRVSSPRPCLL